jgi:hypothetical protein
MRKDLRYNLGSGNFKNGAQILHDALERAADLPEKERNAYIEGITGAWRDNAKTNEIKIRMKIVQPYIGLALLIGILVISYFNPFPSSFQTAVYWAVLSFGLAVGAVLMTGFIEVNIHPGIKATGGAAVLVLAWFTIPKLAEAGMDNGKRTINLAIVTKDSVCQTISADFNPNSGLTIGQFANQSISQYYGRQVSDSDFTCYRVGDGKIYSHEKCKEVKESAILIISNVIERKFSDKHAAFLHFIGKFKDLQNP